MERNCIFKCALSLTDRECKLKKLHQVLIFNFHFSYINISRYNLCKPNVTIKWTLGGHATMVAPLLRSHRLSHLTNIIVEN